MNIIDWGDAATPADEWFFSCSIPQLADWVAARVAGKDGRWNSRAGDPPADLVRVLLAKRSWEVQQRLIEAIIKALQVHLGRDETYDPIALINLAGECRRLTSTADTVQLAQVLTEALYSLAERLDSKVVASLLRARARLLPPIDPHLLKGYFSDSRFAVEAFHCTLNSRPSVVRESFTRLVELVRAGSTEIPELASQARILQERLGFPEFEIYMSELLGCGDQSVADIARTLVHKLDVELPAGLICEFEIDHQETDLPIAAYVNYDGRRV